MPVIPFFHSTHWSNLQQDSSTGDPLFYVCWYHGCPVPPRKKEALPRPALWKLPKPASCGAQRGKVDFNPLKSGRQLQGRIQSCPINICLTHKSVDLRTFLPRHAPPREFFPCPAPSRPAPQTFTLAPPRGLKAPPRASLVDTLYSPHPLQGANHKWSHHARGRTLVDFERHLGECFQRWRQRLILNDSSWCGYRNSDVHGEAAHQLLSWQVTFSQSTAATLT